MARTPMVVPPVPEGDTLTSGILNEDLTKRDKPFVETPTGGQQTHTPQTIVYGPNK